MDGKQGEADDSSVVADVLNFHLGSLGESFGKKIAEVYDAIQEGAFEIWVGFRHNAGICSSQFGKTVVGFDYAKVFIHNHHPGWHRFDERGGFILGQFAQVGYAHGGLGLFLDEGSREFLTGIVSASAAVEFVFTAFFANFEQRGGNFGLRVGLLFNFAAAEFLFEVNLEIFTGIGGGGCEPLDFVAFDGCGSAFAYSGTIHATTSASESFDENWAIETIHIQFVERFDDVFHPGKRHILRVFRRVVKLYAINHSAIDGIEPAFFGSTEGEVLICVQRAPIYVAEVEPTSEIGEGESHVETVWGFVLFGNAGTDEHDADIL